jgi:hypothetical protein
LRGLSYFIGINKMKKIEKIKFVSPVADLSIIKTTIVRKAIIERCGENPVADGLECPRCGAIETYKNAKHPEDTDKWYFLIRAFRVDDASRCCNCNKWFTL